MPVVNTRAVRNLGLVLVLAAAVVDLGRKPSRKAIAQTFGAGLALMMSLKRA